MQVQVYIHLQGGAEVQVWVFVQQVRVQVWVQMHVNVQVHVNVQS